MSDLAAANAEIERLRAREADGTIIRALQGDWLEERAARLAAEAELARLSGASGCCVGCERLTRELELANYRADDLAKLDEGITARAAAAEQENERLTRERDEARADCRDAAASLLTISRAGFKDSVLSSDIVEIRGFANSRFQAARKWSQEPQL